FTSRLSGPGRLRAQLQTGAQVKRRHLARFALRCVRRPGGIAAPRVGASLERGDRGEVGLRSAVLQILSEKRRQDLLAEIERGVAAELDGPQRAAVADHLAMMPRADDEEDLVVRDILRLDRLVDGRGAVDVFLVP